MRESIFFASIRAFFITLFGVVGACIGLIVFIIIIAGTSSSSTSELERKYTVEVTENDEGMRKAYSSANPVILKLNIDGIIGTEFLSMETIRRQLMESQEGDFKNNPVKAILLCINSPGGTVVDADGIYRALKAYKEQYKVPIYAHVDGLCASGGMYVACAADQIFASDVSIVGSVGVLSPSFINVHQLLEKIGVGSLTISAGKGKDELNPLRPWKEGEGDSMKKLVQYYYDFFVDVVTSNRPQMDKTKLVNDYGAHIFNAKLAQEYGFINASGISYRDALKLLAKHIGIEDEKYQVVELKSKKWYDQLFQTKWELLTGKVTHRLELTPDLDPKLSGQFLYLFRPYTTD